MPVEINELSIKASVCESRDPTADCNTSTSGAGQQAALDTIEGTVNEIMDTLKRKNER